MDAYQESLQSWVSGLSNEQIAEYMGNLDAFSDEECDELVREDAHRMLNAVDYEAAVA